MRRILGDLRVMLAERARDDADLLLLLLVLLAGAPLVPTGSALTRDDLLPALTVAVAAAAALRGASLGEGAHPQLQPRRATADAWLQRAIAAATPVVLFLLFEAARDPSVERWLLAGFAVAGLGVLGHFSGEHGRTAWAPPGGRPGGWLVGLGAGLGVMFAGFVAGNLGDGPVSAGILCGLMFLGVGTVLGRPEHLAQRRAAGRRDGRAWQRSGFRVLLGLLGPGVGLAVVLGLHLVLLGGYGFGESHAVVLHAVMWAQVLWPRPVPVAMQCVLHELRPVGGSDSPGLAVHADLPPTGALRVDPLSVVRTRAVHLWSVPVRSGRVASVDDPVAPLWPAELRHAAAHVLGEAAFETDSFGRPQRTHLTLRLYGQQDTVALQGGELQSRRLVVLQPWPDGGARSPATYRWDRRLRDGAIQVVDAATRSLRLSDGAILVLSSEGVARLYELEIGAPIFSESTLATARLPQIEDYAKVGG